MNIYKDKRVVMTLDAGGTNFVFSAMQSGKEIMEPLVFPSSAHDLDLCLKTLIKGFTEVKSMLDTEPVAISFAFPGPADYKEGIIGKLPNLPGFSKGGVALGPMLQHHFNLPVFIANDGDLFAYGEAMAGFLPFINECLLEANVSKQYKNLLGITLGTGFGGGIVVNSQLVEGDNSSSGEIWLMRNFRNPDFMAEDNISIRAIQREYAIKSGNKDANLVPRDIFEIAVGIREGNKEAALHAYEEMAHVIAESLSNAITLIDGLIVIGGGISGAYSLLIPKILELMNGKIRNAEGSEFSRLISKVYDLQNSESLDEFLHFKMEEITIPFTNETMQYTAEKRIGIGLSRLGTSNAIAIGAYALALTKLGQHELNHSNM